MRDFAPSGAAEQSVELVFREDYVHTAGVCVGSGDGTGHRPYDPGMRDRFHLGLKKQLEEHGIVSVLDDDWLGARVMLSDLQGSDPEQIMVITES